MKKKRDVIITAVFGIIFLLGLSVMLYPTFANWWNKHKASHTISVYKEEVAKLDDAEKNRILQEAYDYNEKLADLNAPFTDYDTIPGYDDILNISDTGIMGYVSIPNINVELPIYHGTSEGVLQIASGHIQGSSLPVGGPDTHSVISGHRGLPSAKLFTDLDQLVVGDTFTLNILNDVMMYEVEDILVILPDDTEKLSIIPEKDYVTLMTCTPYGVNTHRLLIRAHRIKTVFDKQVKVSGDALKVDSLTVISVIFAFLVIIMLIYWRIRGLRRKKIYIDKYIRDRLPDERGRKHDKDI
ncbi:MAG: class C sortase [Ruminococcus sp.]|nr:class C sortase [Ruminococcus sp.]